MIIIISIDLLYKINYCVSLLNNNVKLNLQFVPFRSHIPSVFDVKRVNSERGQKAD